jgi:CHASE2 domain-containing sensor protein
MAILHHKRALARRIAVGDDRVSHLPVGAMIRAAVAAKMNRSRTPERLSLYDTFLERLAQHLQDVAAARRPCIQQAPPVVRQRPLAGQRHVAPADQPHSRDGVVRGAYAALREAPGAIHSAQGWDSPRRSVSVSP